MQTATDQDYADALARVEALMDMDRSPSEDEELEWLVTLIQAYEARL